MKFDGIECADDVTSGDRWGVDERTCSTNKKKETKNDWPCLWNFFFLQKSKRHFELGKVFTENGVAHQPTQVTHLLITCRDNRPRFFFFFFFKKKGGKNVTHFLIARFLYLNKDAPLGPSLSAGKSTGSGKVHSMQNRRLSRHLSTVFLPPPFRVQCLYFERRLSCF